MVAYIFDLGTSKEMYDKLFGMFKVNNPNQILFLKNKLKGIKMDKGESIQSYFMRITQIRKDLLSIGEVIADRDLTLIALGGKVARERLPPIEPTLEVRSRSKCLKGDINEKDPYIDPEVVIKIPLDINA